MNRTDFLKYNMLVFINNIDRIYNVLQMEQSILSKIINEKNYEEGDKDKLGKAYLFLKGNEFINTGVNSNGTETISSLTEKGENVLEYNSWKEYLSHKEEEKSNDKKLKKTDLKLKQTTLKNQKFLPYTSISGLVFGIGSMIWSIMDKYDLVFIDISIYFLILLILTCVGIRIYKRL